ncbi:MAG: hypothetical protein IKE73_00695 [Bacilli bacterium]|nr:hypothetical protein [Bacilli bacterium]
MEKNDSKPKRKIRKLKIGYIFAFVIIIAFCVLVLKLVLPASGINKYGDRLEGIEEYKFSEKAKKKVIKNLEDRDQVVSCKIDVQGKIINVIFTVKKEISVEEAKVIASESLGEFSEKIKGYYDLQYMIKKQNEEGRKETKTTDEGETKEITIYEFPIMGYKNKTRDGIIW